MFTKLLILLALSTVVIVMAMVSQSASLPFINKLATEAGHENVIIGVERNQADNEEYIGVLQSRASSLYSSSTVANINGSNNYNNPKSVILIFDDGWKSQYQNAKPILDEFGFKATFFIVCNFVGKNSYMTWNEISDLHDEGHDIQSHSMSHVRLSGLSQEELEYEIGQSKECLQDKGINATVFATPYNVGWDNIQVVNTIAKYYDFAKNGNGPLMFLHCDELRNTLTNQTNCKTYLDSDGDAEKLAYFNRYSIRAWSHNYYDEMYRSNQTMIFEKFVEAVNNPVRYNSGGEIKAITVLEYHRTMDNSTNVNTEPFLFYAEMKYLHDNGFTVLTMSDLKYDESTDHLFIQRSR